MTEGLSASEWEFLRKVSSRIIKIEKNNDILRFMLPRLIAEYDALAEKLRAAENTLEVISYMGASAAKKALFSKNSTERDDAVLAIAHYDDPAHIPILQKAIKQESNKELREDMIKILAQLQETVKEKERKL